MNTFISDFTFYNPVKILFGKNKIEQLTKRSHSDKKILILYGGGVKCIPTATEF